MSRSVLGPRKVAKLQRRFPALAIEKVWARGNTGHRLDLCLKDGTVLYLWPDGTLDDAELKWHSFTAPASREGG